MDEVSHQLDEAFWQLVEAHREKLWRFALGLTRDRDEASDLVSDVVLAAHSNFSQLRDREAFRKSIFTIAIRIHKRKKWRRRIFGPVNEDIAIEDTHESEHDLQLLIDALAKLPVRQREALLLFEISGFSIEEIRDVQGGSSSGVKSRLARGRAQLTLLLTDVEKSPISRIRQRFGGRPSALQTRATESLLY